MSDDWKVGDLALCVYTGPLPCPNGTIAKVSKHPVAEGKTYRVTGLGLSAATQMPILYLAGLPIGRRVERFRKIRPDEHEPCEVEFVELLNRSRVPALARSEAAALRRQA